MELCQLNKNKSLLKHSLQHIHMYCLIPYTDNMLKWLHLLYFYRYSSMDQQSKAMALVDWEKKWSTFIQGVLDEQNCTFTPAVVGWSKCWVNGNWKRTLSSAMLGACNHLKSFFKQSCSTDVIIVVAISQNSGGTMLMWVLAWVLTSHLYNLWKCFHFVLLKTNCLCFLNL